MKSLPEIKRDNKAPIFKATAAEELIETAQVLLDVVRNLGLEREGYFEEILALEAAIAKAKEPTDA